jgi:hypothetical protein
MMLVVPYVPNALTARCRGHGAVPFFRTPKLRDPTPNKQPIPPWFGKEMPPLSEGRALLAIGALAGLLATLGVLEMALFFLLANPEFEDTTIHPVVVRVVSPLRRSLVRPGPV